MEEPEYEDLTLHMTSEQRAQWHKEHVEIWEERAKVMEARRAEKTARGLTHG
jgi:hypothetical protein